ncbi:MAG: AzlD domain-containing protein [Oscillospiraceae bacterium]|nr:AzlD domain-containing protein [Oscillospiraceae bacterium]
MILTTTQSLIIIGVLALGTAITRFLPFVFFPNPQSAPKYIIYLGKMLPAAAISLLVVYCLRYVTFVASPYGIPEAIAITVVAVLHIWKRNTLISILAGTVTYMLLVQFLFY